ncbi:hypothetical protein [Candidatus Nitrospira bockiana]
MKSLGLVLLGLVLMVFTTLGLMLPTTAAHAEAGAGCTAQDRVHLAKAGYAKVDIEALCEQAHTVPPAGQPWEIMYGEGQARWVQWCVTAQGRCPLNPMLGAYPPGMPCNCYMPWGFYSGVAE